MNTATLPTKQKVDSRTYIDLAYPGMVYGGKNLF